MTYLKSELHATWNFNIHFSVLQDLIEDIAASLANVDDSPGQAMSEWFSRFEVDVETDGS